MVKLITNSRVSTSFLLGQGYCTSVFVTLADTAEAQSFTLNSFGTKGTFNQPMRQKEKKNKKTPLSGSETATLVNELQ